MEGDAPGNTSVCAWLLHTPSPGRGAEAGRPLGRGPPTPPPGSPGPQGRGPALLWEGAAPTGRGEKGPGAPHREGRTSPSLVNNAPQAALGQTPGGRGCERERPSEKWDEVCGLPVRWGPTPSRSSLCSWGRLWDPVSTAPRIHRHATRFPPNGLRSPPRPFCSVHSPNWAPEIKAF